MIFNSLNQPYPKSRYSVSAPNGMVSTTSPLASSVGIEIMKKGGNAVDAAVAMAAMLTVVEPCSNGVGSDAFAIVWMKNKIYGINGSGVTPKDISIDKVKKFGYEEMPKRGWIPIMVPGAPATWAELIERFGNLSLSEVLEPAAKYAEEGFTVGPVLSFLFNKYITRDYDFYKNKREHEEFLKVFTDNGKPYKMGDKVIFPDLAKTLRSIGETNARSFYEGELCDKIILQSKRDGGFFRKEDFANYKVEWVDPISVNYRGYDIWELPPNGQGIVTLIALNILKNFNFKDRENLEEIHKQMEAIKIAFAEALTTVTDPKEMKIDYHKYLDETYGLRKAATITDKASKQKPVDPNASGTVYLCTADKEGNMVSYIQSNYMEFGSGVVIEGTGISLQNRGFEFKLDKNYVNALEPNKKTYHTIIPGFITKDNKAIGPFGVMGGYMQPQGHVQVLMNMLDFGLDPQAALDAPRWQWIKDMKFKFEPEYRNDVIKALIEKGHDIQVQENCFSFGRGQIIIRLDNGTLLGGCESRADSCIACY